MRRERVHGFPVVPFTRRLSARRWGMRVTLNEDARGRHLSISLSPKIVQPWVIVQIERADGRVEGKWSPNSSGEM